MSDEQKKIKPGIATNDDLRKVHDTMLDGLSQLADYFGFSKVMGQLYGTLLLNPGPLSLDDMMERLSISKASVSMNMRTLEHMGMVRQVWVRGGSGRRKYYEAETDFWQIITNLFSGREMRDVERAINVMDGSTDQLNEAMKTMSDEERELAELYIERMSQLQGLFQFAQVIITSIITQFDDDSNFAEIKHIEID
ncbi:MAG: helix-turn-helix domain-containing protein [Phototrophicaceae bacterium]